MKRGNCCKNCTLAQIYMSGKKADCSGLGAVRVLPHNIQGDHPSQNQIQTVGQYIRQNPVIFKARAFITLSLRRTAIATLKDDEADVSCFQTFLRKHVPPIAISYEDYDVVYGAFA